MKTTELCGVVAECIADANAMDLEAAVATFAHDAYVNDNRREFVGTNSVRAWLAKEMIGDTVTIDVREVLDHHGDTIVRGLYDGPTTRPTSPRRSCCRTTSASATTGMSALS